MQPWWLARQRDPDSAAYHPSGGAPVNAVGRSWTLVGTLDGSLRTAVDRRGLIAVDPGRWSLDWWIRAEDRWIHPSVTGGVRQSLIDGAPVVETRVRAGGGDIVHRVYAARVGDGDGLIVEVENEANAPVALALAIRPYDVQGPGRIHSLSLRDRRVFVDGALAMELPREPGEFLASGGGVDAAELLDAETGPATEGAVECADGRANAAVVLPLVHGTSVQVVVPVGGVGDATIDRAPSAEQVARGWGQHAVTACRVVLPAGRLADGFDAMRQALMLARTGGAVRPAPLGPPSSAADDADILEALVDAGYLGTVKELLIERGRRQHPLGSIAGADGDVTASTLVGAHRLLEVEADDALLTALSEVVADAGRWLVANPEVELAARGLESAAGLLEAIGAAEAASHVHEALGQRSAAGTARVAEILDTGLVVEREGPLGVDALASAQRARAVIDTDPAQAVALIDELLEMAGPTWTLPTYLHPRLHTGTGGAGHDLRITALLVQSIVRLLVDDRSPTLRLAAHWPAAWWGQGVEVHGIPSRHGAVSWAVRWHGERPALLWEVEGGPDDLAVAAPGLDGAFSATGASGEALLAAVPAPEPPADESNDGIEEPPPPPSGGTFA